MSYCTHCGQSLAATAAYCPHCGSRVPAKPRWSPADLICRTGRLSRKGYAIRALLCYSFFQTVASLCYDPSDLAAFFYRAFILGESLSEFYGFFLMYLLVTAAPYLLKIPLIFFSLRRCHDIGIPGWLSVLSVLPFIGFPFLLWLCLVPGEEKANRYGRALRSTPARRETSSSRLGRWLEERTAETLGRRDFALWALPLWLVPSILSLQVLAHLLRAFLTFVHAIPSILPAGWGITGDLAALRAFCATMLGDLAAGGTLAHLP